VFVGRSSTTPPFTYPRGSVVFASSNSSRLLMEGWHFLLIAPFSSPSIMGVAIQFFVFFSSRSEKPFFFRTPAFTGVQPLSEVRGNPPLFYPCPPPFPPMADLPLPPSVSNTLFTQFCFETQSFRSPLDPVNLSVPIPFGCFTLLTN